MPIAFAFQCLCALQLVYVHRAVAQSDPAAPRLRVNGGFADVLVNGGSEVRLQCEDETGAVDADYFLSRNEVELPLLDSISNTRVIASMSVEDQGGYRCRTKQPLRDSTNEIAIISKWVLFMTRNWLTTCAAVSRGE